MDESNALYLNTPPGRLFLKAAVPGIISMLAGTLFSLVDGIFIGQILGDIAFAAASLAIPFTIVNFALAELIGTGSSVLVALLWNMGLDGLWLNNPLTSLIISAAAGFLIVRVRKDGLFRQK